MGKTLVKNNHISQTGILLDDFTEIKDALIL